MWWVRKSKESRLYRKGLSVVSKARTMDFEFTMGTPYAEDSDDIDSVAIGVAIGCHWDALNIMIRRVPEGACAKA